MCGPLLQIREHILDHLQPAIAVTLGFSENISRIDKGWVRHDVELALTHNAEGVVRFGLVYGGRMKDVWLGFEE
jgi:hypothetical protein